MKNAAVLLTIILFSVHASGQPNRSTKPVRKSFAAKNAASEKAELERAVALADTTERVATLVKFVEDYPKSKEKNRALELVASGRAAIADEKFRAGEKTDGIELFKLAVRDAPKPISDKLYAEVIAQIPSSLFFRSEVAAAIEIAKLVEEKADGNAKQLLVVAAFYLGMENAAEAKRLADKAIVLEPNLPAAFQTLGLAHRLDFQLEESAAAYAKALEFDGTSIISKRSLAEMKRATGKTAEAVQLYREIAATNPADAAAQTGLILALFDAENKTESESELAKSLEANPNNLPLLVGAAYWYAANNDGGRAVELAEKAVAVEPRYTWARIALARGLMQQKRPLEAEKALLAARQYGDFPTLDYELAAARYQSGFYREASETLQKKFSVADGTLKSKLGGRVSREAKSFVELLAAERRASIFQTLAADNIEAAEKLKSLLDFSQKLENAASEAISQAADEFVKGDDRMKIHRQLFAADQLLQKRKALPKVLELTKAAIGGVDAGLEMPNSTAAVLADELYQSRRLAIARSELIVVPDVPRQTLSGIVRGRIEDISGWALFQENKSAEAIVRLKRAVSVLPEKSSYWRSSMWRLGTAQDAAGNSKAALDAYIKSYVDGESDPIKYTIIETAYQKVNGNTDGLAVQIGAKPVSVASNFPAQKETISTEPTTAVAEPTPEIKTESVAPMPEVKTEVAPISTVAETPTVETKPSPETSNTENTEKPSEPKITQSPQTQPEVKTETLAVEKKTETNPVETKLEVKQPETIADQNAETASKSLFEPVIINVPKTEPLRKPTPEVLEAETQSKPEIVPTTDEKVLENATPKVEAETLKATSESTKIESETPKTETEAAEPTEEKKPSDETPRTRPRVIIEDSLQPAATCRINVSQERVSILNDGGNSSLLVGIEGESDTKEIKATSSNPADVVIVSEPEVTVKSGRAFFIVKSISQATGIFTITFESACGKKEVLVKVR